MDCITLLSWSLQFEWWGCVIALVERRYPFLLLSWLFVGSWHHAFSRHAANNHRVKVQTIWAPVLIEIIVKTPVEIKRSQSMVVNAKLAALDNLRPHQSHSHQSPNENKQGEKAVLRSRPTLMPPLIILAPDAAPAAHGTGSSLTLLLLTSPFKLFRYPSLSHPCLSKAT